MWHVNICIITSLSFPPEEGIGNYIYNLSKKFIDDGHNVSVITRGKFGRTSVENFEGITLYKVTYLPLYPLHVHLHRLFVKNLLKSLPNHFDIIHYHTPLPPAIRTLIPTITTVHTPMKTDVSKVELVDFLSISIKFQGYISSLIEKELFHISEKITSVASSVSEELKEYGLNPADVEVIGNGVDETIFYPIQNKSNEKYILYTGRLSYRKGLFDFIKCSIKVCEIDPSVNIKLTGKGPLSEKLKQIVNESGYENRFQFLGHVDKSKLIELYQNATIFVLPSHYEGLPTTLLEAMACRLPIVATAVSGNLDVIESGKNGILVPVKNPEKMAEAVLLLLNDENLRLELGTCARKTIEEKYTWTVISKKILGCYRNLLQTNNS